MLPLEQVEKPDQNNSNDDLVGNKYFFSSLDKADGLGTHPLCINSLGVDWI